jgi:hypothetical protein
VKYPVLCKGAKGRGQDQLANVAGSLIRSTVQSFVPMSEHLRYLGMAPLTPTIFDLLGPPWMADIRLVAESSDL